MQAPVAKRIPHNHELHGDVRPDDYFWLRNRDNPDVIAYLEEENRYYQEAMEPLEPLTKRLYEEMIARIPETEANVPVKDGPYFYYSRMDKELQYPIYARKRAESRDELDNAPEEVILDVNALAEDGGYLSVTELRVSPDHTRLAYLVNRDGTDEYDVQIVNLSTGDVLSDKLPKVFIGESLEWDQTGEYLFYVTVDDSQRPYQVWRHRVGTPGPDVMVYEESDITFVLTLEKSQSGQYLFLKSETKTTAEVRYLKADDPVGTLHILDARKDGVLYTVEHWGDEFLILTNEGATNFRLLHAPVGNPSQKAELFPYDEARYLEGLHPFQTALLISGRQDGMTQVWTYRDGALDRIDFDDTVYTVHVGANRAYDVDEVLLQYESYLRPRTTYGFNLSTRARTVLQIAPVAGNFDASDYHQERLWATAEDGTLVPMLAVYKRDALQSGPAPLILDGYGSYGFSLDPHFQPILLPLLDLGVVHVTAQIRGGSEMGHSWYEDGKLFHKRNTFTDFISVAKDLIERGYTSSETLAATGRSAGGLLIGAVANLSEGLFQVLMAGVPFVDVVTTMLDATIPLTSLEWDEWGNPAEPDYYAYMKSYSPYDNVTPKDYPHMLVTTGLNDPRVAYWEPAKWVARLRATKTDDNQLIMKTHMGAGHFGSSGRFNHIRELAENYAFLLDKIGVQIPSASTQA